MMLTPSIFRENLWNDWMNDPFGEMDGLSHGRRGEHVMRTDVIEKEQTFEVDIELPGYKKDEVKAELKDGYLTVTAMKAANQEEKSQNGRYVRRERYSGNMSRAFYVGEAVRQDEIHAKFEDGILKLQIPKKDPRKQVEENHFVTIE